MSIIDKIRQEIERLKKILEESTYYLDNSQQALGYSFALDDFSAFIDSLPDEPVSNDLEEAAETFCDTLEGKEAWSYGPAHYDWDDVNNAFIAGAEWMAKQKEQKEIPLMNGDADLFFDEWNQQHSNSTKRECFEAGVLYAVRLLTEDSPMLEEFKKGLEQVILWGKEGYKVSPDGTTKSQTQDEIDEVLDEQKEQKHPNGCFTCDEYKKGYEEGRRNGFTAGYNKAMKEVEQKEQKPVVTLGETYHVDTLGTQQVIAGKMPQKPAEWSEEDKKMLISIINDFAQGHKSSIGQEKWLKSLRPQPKQEWSEEDEEMLNSCISSIEESKENRYAYKENDGDTSYDREIAWLKSLRPSWKPSENQMSMLLAVVNDPNNAGSESCHLSLESLYYDLKKL